MCIISRGKMARRRDEKGGFSLIRGNPPNKVLSKGKNSYEVDHDYFPQQPSSSKCRDDAYENINVGKHVDREGWKEGRRLVELFVLLSSLKTCTFCRLGPVPPTVYSIIGEMKKGLRGYWYVRCMNPDCGQVNIAPYGKTHRRKKKSMPCFVANTKLGTCKYICLQNYRLVL